MEGGFPVILTRRSRRERRNLRNMWRELRRAAERRCMVGRIRSRQTDVTPTGRRIKVPWNLWSGKQRHLIDVQSAHFDLLLGTLRKVAVIARELRRRGGRPASHRVVGFAARQKVRRRNGAGVPVVAPIALIQSGVILQVMLNEPLATGGDKPARTRTCSIPENLMPPAMSTVLPAYSPSLLSLLSLPL